MSRRSPFKFLDAYGKADRAIFFGRDDEIEDLYEMVYQSNLTLVYGQSGTGKTSLIKCGLANRFKASDWLDVYIRRKDNINTSLLEALTKLRELRQRDSGSSLQSRLKKLRSGRSADIETADEEQGRDREVVKVLRDLDRQYFKPIYLIFDQFEELFILGDQENEQPEFYQTISDILEECPFCKLIFVLREEAIANLHDFEKVVPILFDKRLRVEQLSRAKVRSVITKTAEQFEISLENDGVADAVIEAISSGKGRAELTYLQVFLDALWNQATQRSSEQVVFTHADIDALGGIDDVLAEFLSAQSALIQERLEAKFSNVDEKAIAMVLDAFVSVEGTKQPRAKSELQLAKVNDEQITYCLDSLEQARILRFDEERFELSHDALAARIAQSRSSSDVAYLEVVRLIRDRFRAFGRTKSYLNNNELILYQTYEKRIKEEAQLTDEEQAYVRKSRIENSKRRRRRNITIAAVGTVLFIGLLFMSKLWFNVRTSSYDQLMGVANREFNDGQYDQYVMTLRAAYDIIANDSIKEMEEAALEFQRDKEFYEQKVGLADSLIRQDGSLSYLETSRNLVAARKLLESTNSLTLNERDRNYINSQLQTLEVRLNSRHSELVRSAGLMYAAGSTEGFRQALVHYTVANEIRQSSDVEELIFECRRQIRGDG